MRLILGLRDRIQVVIYAYETGLIAPRERRTAQPKADVRDGAPE